MGNGELCAATTCTETISPDDGGHTGVWYKPEPFRLQGCVITNREMPECKTRRVGEGEACISDGFTYSDSECTIRTGPASSADPRPPECASIAEE